MLILKCLRNYEINLTFLNIDSIAAALYRKLEFIYYLGLHSELSGDIIFFGDYLDLYRLADT